MSTVVVIGDVHLSDRPPSRRRDTYAEEILVKVEFCVHKAQQNGCSAIVLLGDLFHIKTPSRTSHALVQRTHEVLTEPGIPVWIVPGNHDMTGDRLDSMDSQPLGTLARMEGVDLLVGPHPSLPLYGIEYLQDWQDLPARMAEFSEWAEQHRTYHPGGHVLLGMHAPIFPDHKHPPYDYISASDVASMSPERTTIAYGHIHDPEGCWKPLKDDQSIQVANYGALSRGSLHAETLKRQPQAYLWDSTNGKIEPFDVPVKPVAEVFDMTEVEQEKISSQRMTAFLDDVGTTTVEVTSLEAVDAHVQTLDVEADVATAVTDLVEWAREQ